MTFCEKLLNFVKWQFKPKQLKSYSNNQRSTAREPSPLEAHQAKLLYNLIWF